MSDKTIDAVKAFLQNRAFLQKRLKQGPHIDSMHQMEMAKGKRAKRVIDMKRTNQDYYMSVTIHQPLLNHYENVDWFERDTDNDFTSYMDRV